MKIILLLLFINIANCEAVTVAVIDTGIKASKYSHLLSSSLGTAITSDFGLDTTSKKKDTTPMDINGHGTHISGIIIG